VLALRLPPAPEMYLSILPRGMFVAALEHEVLEEMREAGAVRPLVFAAHVVEHVSRDDGARA
jgi:hypothetical protein